jgi:hypothetical protein
MVNFQTNYIIIGYLPKIYLMTFNIFSMFSNHSQNINKPKKSDLSYPKSPSAPNKNPSDIEFLSYILSDLQLSSNHLNNSPNNKNHPPIHFFNLTDSPFSHSKLSPHFFS